MCNIDVHTEIGTYELVKAQDEHKKNAMTSKVVPMCAMISNSFHCLLHLLSRYMRWCVNKT